MSLAFDIDRESDDLASAAAGRAFSDREDGELMRRAIDVIYQLRMRLETQAEAMSLSTTIIAAQRARLAQSGEHS